MHLALLSRAWQLRHAAGAVRSRAVGWMVRYGRRRLRWRPGVWDGDRGLVEGPVVLMLAGKGAVRLSLGEGALLPRCE